MDKFLIEGELDRSWIVSLLAEGLNTYQILINYDVTEQTISESSDLLNKEVLLQGFDFTETFIRESLLNSYFSSEDLLNLTMTTYSNLSDSFIEDFKESLNWQKILIYLSTQTNNFTSYLEIIDRNNLWSLISANDLPTDFVRQYKDKLDWTLLSMTKFFTEDEKMEFSDFIVNTKGELSDEESKSFGSLNIVPEFEKDYSIDDISDLIDKYMINTNKDFYININEQ